MPHISHGRRAVFAVVTLLIFLPMGSAAQQTRPAGTIESLYHKAREAEARKNYLEAAGYYEQILKIDQTLHPLRANLGLMRYLGGEFDKAAQDFRKALAGDARLTMAHLF